MASLSDKRRSLLEEKEKIFDIMKIFTIILDNENRNDSASNGIPPSIYMRQMSLTTEERTACSIKQERSKSSAPITDHSRICFRATPRIVIFQNFSPGSTYSVKLSVKNITSYSQHYKMMNRKNSWFTIDCKDSIQKTKLAPGMSVNFDVKFIPEEKRDYGYQAVFENGVETLTVPILGIGPRPLLDFPDFIDVPQTAVKIVSLKHFLVRNIGDVPAVFSLSTTKPFTVLPEKGVLAEGETMQVTIEFFSVKKGCFKGDLSVIHETGEIVSLSLTGSAENSVIILERGRIKMEETYLGLSRSETFTVQNRGNYISNFRWVLYEDGRRDELELEKYKKSFEMIKKNEVSRRMDLEHYNICDSYLHELACQRIFADEVSGLENHTFPFTHPNYRFIPEEGEIWPHSSIDLTLIFEPNEVRVIESTAYLEVTGCEERIPLNLHGVCIGPLIKLNLISADLGSILLCSNHNYEVICANKGDIPGTLVYDKKSPDFGGRIEVIPAQAKLKPGCYKSLNLSFSSNRTGDFTERINFVVKESFESISFLIKGSVICPTLHFDKQNLDFGVTALGFTTKHDVCLHNSSLVPVTFCLSITQDGTQPALTHEDFAKCVNKPSLLSNPKEFTISPSEGVVAPCGFQKIKILYTPNVVRSSQTALRADMWDSDSEPVMLPIIFSSKVATIVVKPSEILIRFCFINFLYVRTITVENKSDVEGYFYLPPQPVTPNSPVIYSLSSYQAYLKPNESKSLSLKIVTSVLGRQKVQLSLLIFGDRTFSPGCSLVCNGQGPIVTVQPTHLNWGEVQLLEETNSTITLVNDSPIPVQFVARLHKTPSPWTVSLATGALEPGKSLELEITLYLCDTGKYSDGINIAIFNGRVITCFLNAVGIGSSISFTPKIMPIFDMGLLFRDQDISIPITMANKGTRHHRLTWTTTPDSQGFQTNGASDRQPDKFAVDPHIVELPPGTESIINCKIRWGEKESLTEQWYFYGQIKGEQKRQVLGTSLFKATFINPIISFSKRKLTFQYNPSVCEAETNFIDTLFATNLSGLDLKACVNIDPPFEIMAENEDDSTQRITAIVLRNEIATSISIRFKTKTIDLSNLYSRTYQKPLTFEYETHRAKDKIECIAEVNFPNISISPMESVILNCEIGSTAEKNVTFINSGNLPVCYRFEWQDVNVIRTPNTIPYDAQLLRSEDSTTIFKNRESTEEDAYYRKAEKRESQEEDFDSVGCSFEREIAETSSTIEFDRAKSFGSSATMNDNVDPNDPKDDASLTSPSKFLSSSLMARTSDLGPNDLRTVSQVSPCGIRDCKFEMLERYFHEETEISVSNNSQTGSKDEQEYDTTGSIEDILEVAPWKGIVEPHSSQLVHFKLKSSERVRIEAKIACRVESGPMETICVEACADVISYSIDKQYIDLRWQLFGELCRETFTIVNQGAVGFSFETYVQPGEALDEIKQTEQIHDFARLRVEPKSGIVDPMSETSLEVIYYVDTIGPIEAQFDLQIADRVPLAIRVGGYGSLQQAYLNARPRSEAFELLPAEICYPAIDSLTGQILTEVRGFVTNVGENAFSEAEEAQGYHEISESERERLMANEWELISGDKMLPTTMDIEMAIERFLAVEYVAENPFILANNSPMNKRVLSSLSVPEYVVDMGYVVIERVAYYSTTLINYGPTPMDVRIKKVKGKWSLLKKSGIVVKFRDRKDLLVGESTPLNITFNPTGTIYTEKRTDVEQTIYLEVTQGATIPISVRAVATYPSLTVHTGNLSFEEVSVGNCMLMPILLRNEGCVPCEWQATIRCDDSYRSKQEIGPFFLHYNEDTFLPGFENVINVYFKPKEAKYSTGQLRIKIEQSIFPIFVSISGTGIAPELQVFEDKLNFGITLPFSKPEQKTFMIKNTGLFPVELFWWNIDTIFFEEEKIVRILTRYYGVDEILFPPRKPGDKLSPRIYQFYETLINEVTKILEACKSAEEYRGEGKKDGRIHNVSRIALPEPIEESKTQVFDHPKDLMFKKFSGFNADDPEEVEALLYYYIDQLHAREDFSETMKDPMKVVFEDAETKAPSIHHSAPSQRACIIFHGAPFTEYQESACKVGRTMGVAVLNIDNAITEIIAIGNSSCSYKLREIVDKNYQELLSSSESYRKTLKPESENPELNSGDVGSPKTPNRKSKDLNTSSHGLPKTPRKLNDFKDIAEDCDEGMKILLKLPTEPDVLEEFNKIPQPEDLASMDPLDEWEYKIQSILLLEKIMTSATSPGEKIHRKTQRDVADDNKTSARSIGTSRTKKLNEENTFLGINSDLIYEALRQRLAMQDFSFGFTVQTLDNVFVKNERDTLIMLLSLAGNIRHPLFLTFHNSLDLCLTQNDKLVAAEEMEKKFDLERKLSDIEQMEYEEYQQISEGDKILYSTFTLPPKRADNQRRHLAYDRKLMGAKSNGKNTLRFMKSTSTAALTHESRTSKSQNKTAHSEGTKSSVQSSNESHDVVRKTKQSTSSRSEKTPGGTSNAASMKKKLEVPKQLEEISRLMDSYRASLASLQPVLSNWDSQTATFIENGTTTKNKTPKSIRDNDVTQQTKESNGIDIWYIAPSDPWNSDIHGRIASHLAEIGDIEKVVNVEDRSKISLDPKSYSVVRQKSSRPISASSKNGVFALSSYVKVSARTSAAIGEDSRNVGSEESKSFSTDLQTRLGSMTAATEVVEEPLKSRWIIQPNEICKFKVSFAPKNPGDYRDEYRLGIVGSSLKYSIKIHGSSDIPRLNMTPEIIFDKVVESKSDDLNTPAYFRDTKTYDFGSIPLIKSYEERLRRRRKAEFTLSNTSAIPATVSILRIENSDVFDFAPDLFEIPPGKSDILNVWAGVSKPGENFEGLILCVRNNPRVEKIQLRSFGSKVEIELEGKVVAFGKMLLRRKSKRNIIVRNKSNIPFYWRLDFSQNFSDSQVILHPGHGHVEPLATSDIECSYSAELVGNVEREIPFQAFLDKNDKEPVLTDLITIAGESYDVNVDLIDASPIDFKNVKVGTSAREFFTIRNRGPYDIGFIIQFETKLDFPPTFNNDFKIEPGSGSLSPEKPIVIVVNFSPRIELAISEAPILKCLLIDMHKTPSTTVAELPLLVSVSAHYAKIKVRPNVGLNFGAMAIFDKRSMHFEIENIGYFSFKYKINGISLDPLILIETSDKKDNKSEKTEKSARATSRTGTAALLKNETKTPRTAKATRSGGDQKIASLKIGPFSLSNDEGEIEAGKFETIEVQCCPNSVGLFEEEIQVSVSNGEKNEKSLKLSVNSCIPTINLVDLDAIFCENLVVDELNDFVCPWELGPHSIFVRQEKCLYFRCVSLSCTHNARLRLHNPGLVSSNVIAKINSEMIESALQGDGSANAFTLEPQKATISPMSTGIFTLSFFPKLLGNYAAVFTIGLELPPPLKAQRIDIKVCGEATVPEVVLLEPITSCMKNQILLNFGRSSVAEVAYREIIFKNIGSIEAKVIAEISQDANGLFTFETVDKDIQTPQYPRHIKSIEDQRHFVRCLMPEEVMSSKVKFAPEEVGRYEGRVDILTVNNPYGKISLLILGESFVEDVIIEGLPLTENVNNVSLPPKRSSRSRKGSRDSQLKSPLHTSTEFTTPIMTYKLDYGSCFLNELKQLCFKMINKSDEKLFRFEWISHSNVVFTPSVGYLNSNGNKDIIAAFSALEPMVCTETQLECRINEISQLSGEINENSWDDRQVNVRWDAGESSYSVETGRGIDSRNRIFTKVIEPTPEPATESFVVPGSAKTIRVLLTAAVAYSRYDCEIREINLKDVMMFQSCKYTFVLSNPGIVNMAYEWNFQMDEEHSKRLSNSALWEVLRSLDKPCVSSPRPKNVLSRTLSGILKDNVSSWRCNAGNKSISMISTTASSESSIADYLPFEIVPEAGSLSPGESVECTIAFSPLDVFEYRVCLTCRIENLDPDSPPLSVIVTARSLLPHCHFVLPQSNYLTGGKRDSTSLGLSVTGIDGHDSASEGIKVIEIQAIGAGKTLVKKFCMINPTTEDYRFSWRELKTVRCVGEISYFHCNVAEGVAESGKQTEFTFTFLAKDIGVFESLWIFSIEGYELETTFLFVATVKEPSVYLFPRHLEIKPTVTDVTACGTMKIFNSESIELPFRIMPESLCSDDHLQRLVVEPMFGMLHPNSEEQLKIEFNPASSGEIEFSLQCRVDRLRNPLTAIVTTTIYGIEPCVVYKNGDGDSQQIHRDGNNELDCGKMQLNKPFTLNIHITNVGGSAFRYKWDLGSTVKTMSITWDKHEDENCTDESVDLGEFRINVKKKQGRIVNQSSDICSLVITTRRRAAVLNHRVTLKIQRGPEYAIFLKGVVQDPSYLINFNEYDFGPSYIQSGSICHYTAKIHFTNNEETPCTFDCKIESLPHLRVCHEHLTGAVPGLSSVSIPVKFIPLERVCYRETIILIINSTIKEKVTIIGEGIEYKVRLLDQSQKSVDLGNLRVGKSAIKKIPLINKGRAPILLRIGLSRELPGYVEAQRKLKGCESYRDCHGDPKESSMQEESRSSSRAVLTVEPSEPITLCSNEQIDISVRYSPIQRTKTFEEKISCQMHETILPLFIVRGSCKGAEFTFNRKFLSFGTVVEGCSRRMKIALRNTGDISGRFAWNVDNLIPHYDLAPRTGYCSPGMEASFTVTFSPICQSNFIEGNATVNIENYDTMSLTMTGACKSLPEPIKTVDLSTRVRQSTSVDITVLNTSSDEMWTLQPVVSGQYFSATKIFSIPPLKSNVCTVTYEPLSMTHDDQLHRGTILFKVPDGQVLLYDLVGKSLSPEPVAKIIHQFPTRTKYTELLTVFNWLKKTQRFSCIVELLDDVKGNPLYNFLGNKTIDIPSEGQRDYRAVFESYKEGNFHFRVTFKNDDEEFQFYELQYKVTKPEIADTIKLTAVVRTVACWLLKVENPLKSQSVTYTIESPHPDLSISESPKLVDPESSGNVKIEFNPMVPFESVVMLDASCPDLGTFSYALSLRATPAPPEKLVHVAAMLGASASLSILIKNLRKQTANFLTTIDDPSFSCGRSISVEGFGEANITVTYEPSELRNVAASLTANSQTAGEYIFPIIGTTLPPKPQGPFTVTTGRAASISFKNIFNETKTFEFHVDESDLFRIDRLSETIQSKKTANITVRLLPQNNPGEGRDIAVPIIGKLTVCSTDAALARIKWVYYLRGVFEEYK